MTSPFIFGVPPRAIARVVQFESDVIQICHYVDRSVDDVMDLMALPYPKDTVAGFLLESLADGLAFDEALSIVRISPPEGWDYMRRLAMEPR